MSHKSTHHARATLAAAILACCGALGACAGRPSRFEVPPDATPEARAAALAKAESLARDAQRSELAGKTDRAIEQYKSAIETYRELPAAWTNVGVLLQRKGLNLQAAEAYKTASELSPRDPTPLYNLGTLWESLGYLDDAARWYDEALQRDPNHAASLRRSVLVDDLRNKLSQTTAERLKAAILIEREPWWTNRFKRIQQRMGERPLEADDHGAPLGEPPAASGPAAPPAVPARPPADARPTPTLPPGTEAPPPAPAPQPGTTPPSSPQTPPSPPPVPIPEPAPTQGNDPEPPAPASPATAPR